jgi:hypothetical protein
MKTPPGGQKSPVYGVFRRSLSREHARLMESTCKNCRSFVAASVRPEMLDFIEKLHLCIFQRQFPGKPVTSA